MMNEKKRTEYVNLFEENESLKTKINDEGIGCIHMFPSKTKVAQSIADGKGLTEAIVGIQANFVLTTRNAEGQQCYKKRDQVTAEIGNHCFIWSNSSA